jgi:hypothetical protein
LAIREVYCPLYAKIAVLHRKAITQAYTAAKMTANLGLLALLLCSDFLVQPVELGI